MRTFGGEGGGGKASGGRTPREAPDTLRSVATVRVLMALSEGEIAGLPPGKPLAQCVRFDGVPVENPDGTRNFEGVSLTLRTGTADQSYIPGFAQVESTVQISATVAEGAPVEHAITSADIDAARVIVAVPRLTTVDPGTGDMSGGEVAYRIEILSGGTLWIPLVEDVITGKTVSGYERARRVELPPERPAVLRVVRVTPDSTSAFVDNTLILRAVVEISDAKLAHPHLAVLGVEAPASAVNGRVPLITAELDWLRCWTPSNFDPVTRSYAGIWDGVLILQWTDDPAWQLYTALRDELWGLGDRIEPDQIDKWSFFEASVYNAGVVPDGLGGTGARFSSAGTMATREEAQSWLARLAAQCRGALIWAAGGVRLVQDRPAAPGRVFNQANVVDGMFRYTGAALSARASVAVVSLRNPDAQGRIEPLATWEDADLIETFGWRSRDVTMPFEPSVGGGIRAARWIVETDGRTPESVSFDAGADAIGVEVGDVILIGDPSRAQLRASGRLIAVAGSTLTLDAPVTLAPGGVYTLATHDDQGSLVSMPLAPGQSGAVTAVTLADPAPAGVAPGHAWVLTDAAGALGAWRVVSTAEAGSTGMTITALAEDPGKYARVDGTMIATQPAPSVPAPAGRPEIPGVLSIVEWSRPRDGAAGQPAVTVSWPSSTDARVDRWRVELRAPGSGWREVGVTFEPTIDVILDAGIAAGYAVRVRAETQAALFSAWRSATFDAVGPVSGPEQPVPLALDPGINAITVRWAPLAAPDIAAVEVLAGQTAAIGGATVVGRTLATELTHGPIPGGSTWWYWLRSVRLGGGVTVSDPVAAGSATALRVGLADLDAELDDRIADIEASAAANAVSVTQLESDAAALIALRVVSGSAGAALELVAANDPAGAVSVARVSAGQILLSGSVTADLIDVGTLLAEDAFIDNLRVGSINYLDGSIQTTAVEVGAINRAIGGVSGTDGGSVVVGSSQVRTDDLAVIDMGSRGGTLAGSVSAEGSATGSQSTELRLLLDGVVAATYRIPPPGTDSLGAPITASRIVTLYGARVVGPGPRTASVEMVNFGASGSTVRFAERVYLVTGLLA